MLRRGGEPVRLERRARRVRPRRLVLIVDVSGSMQPYADPYLRFAHAAARRRTGTEVFTVGTRLTRVTREMRSRDPSAALLAVSGAVPDWSGGTRLGELVKAFLDRWGQRGVARGAVVVVASDGWERGDATLLGAQMARLARLAHRVVWVNPHRGHAGLRADDRRHAAPRCRTSTTSSTATRFDCAGPAGGAAVRRWPPCMTSSTRWPACTTAGEPVRAGHRRRHLAQRAAAARCRDGGGRPTASRPAACSGGCVEGAVYELAQEVMASGEPVLQRYGVSDDDAFAVGLTCGGIIDIFVEPVDAAHVPRAARRGRLDPGARAGRRRDGRRRPGQRRRAPGGVAGPGRRRAGHASASTQAVVDDVRGVLDHGANRLLRIGPDGERRQDELSVFVQSFAPPPRMLVFGAIDFAAAVARVGKFLGYRVTVCDARGVFATRKRFPEADEVVVEWPHRYLATPAGRRAHRDLRAHPRPEVRRAAARGWRCRPTPPTSARWAVALQTDAAYIGAMGSRRTHDDRLARLRDEGVPEEALARLSSPIGLDIGARTPEETAVSIAAEIVAHRWGGTGARLAGTDGPIHR